MTDRPKRARTVIDSINDDAGRRCVDIFQRADGSWGFEEYRRDPEDGGKWTVIGHYADQLHDTREVATRAAQSRIGWLGARLAARNQDTP